MPDQKHKRNLRRWMVDAHAIDTPTGPKVLCGECGVELSDELVTIGHWPIPAYLGGTVWVGAMKDKDES